MTRDELLKKICPWGTCDCGNDYESCNCDDCNRVLEEWLYDYEKHIIEQYKADTNLKDTIREIHDNVAQEMYCKGIDDCMKALITMYERYDIDDVFKTSDTYSYTNACYIFEHYIKEIAKQLKAGVNNE